MQWEKVWLFTLAPCLNSFCLCPMTFPSVLPDFFRASVQRTVPDASAWCARLCRVTARVCRSYVDSGICSVYTRGHFPSHASRALPGSFGMTHPITSSPQDRWAPSQQQGRFLPISLNRFLKVELGCAAQWEATESRRSGVFSHWEEGAGQTAPSRKRRLRPQRTEPGFV